MELETKQIPLPVTGTGSPELGGRSSPGKEAVSRGTPNILKSPNHGTACKPG